MSEGVSLRFPNSVNTFIVKSNDFELLKKILIYYGSIASYCTSEIENHEKIIIISYFNELLTAESTCIKTILCHSSNVDFVVSCILRYVRKNIILGKGYCLYHSSSVLLENCVVLFAGASSSGKTTLTSFLAMKKDAIVLSEDITMLNYLDLQVVPILRPVMLRMNSCELLRNKYNISFDSCEIVTYSGSERIAISESFKNYPQSCGLDKIFFLNLDEKKKSVEIQGSFEKLLVNSYSDSDMINNICSARYIANKISMYELYYYDLEEAYEIIRNI